MEKIEAELKEAETKQRSLSKAYECVHAQAGALIIFAVQWKDLEEHFESTRYSLELQLRELARRETDVRVRYGELEAKEMKFNSEIESKAGELGGLQRLIDEKVEDVIQSKNRLHSLQSSIQERSNEVMVQEKRLMEVEGFVVEKKRECDSIEKRVERRQKKLDWVEEKLKLAEEKSKLAEVKAEEVRGFEEALEKCVEEIELKKWELNEIIGSIEKRKEEFNSIGEQIMEAEKLMKVQEQQMGFKEERIKEAQRAVEQCDKELKWREKLITEAERAVEQCDKKLKMKKEKVEDVIQSKNRLHSLQSSIQERCNEVMVQEKRLMEVEGFVVEKKRECDSIEKRVERRQKKLDWVEEKLKLAEEKSKLAEVKAEEVRGFEEALEKCVEEIELKKWELNEIIGSIEKRKEEFNSIGEQIMEAEKLMKVQEQQMGFKEERIKEAQRAVEQCDKELKWREKLITEAERAVEECDKKLKMKKEKLVVIDKSLAECSNALESREKKIREIDSKKDKDLCLREKSLEEWSCKLEFKEREVRLGERIVELKAGELRESKEEGERCLESLSQVLKQKENRRQDLDEELELKKKELDLIKKSTEERAKNLELKERQLEDQAKELELKQKGFYWIKKFSEERTQNLKSKANTSILLSQVKTEQLEHIPANNVVVPSTSSNQSSVNMDGRGLLLFINEHLKRYVLLGSEISAVLQASPDPAKLVLDAMQRFYHANSSVDKSECDFESITRVSCILLLETLKSVSPQINPEVREEAIKLAGDWKVKMRTENCLEVLGFLRFVSTYGITSFYDAKELQSLCAIVANDEHTTELSWAFGMTGKAPAKIEAPESSLANNAGTCSSPNLQLTATTDATHLQGILNELFSRDRLIQTETWAAFQSSSEPEKFVMDVMQTSFDKYCRIEDAGFKEIVMANYISLLDMLMRIKPHFNKDALMLAVTWKSKIGASTQPLELLGFLQFIATYGLLSMFNRETLVFLGRISQQKQTLEICLTLGLADKIPDIIRDLIEKKQLIEAVRLICPFKLIDKFPPVPLLKEFVENAKLVCIQMSKTHKLLYEKDKCVNNQIAALRVVIQCIKDCNLESKYPSRFIETRIACLEKMKKNRRHQMTSPPSKVEQQGKKNFPVSKVEGQEQKQSPASKVEGREQKKSPSPRVEGREEIKPLASNVEQQGADKPFASTVEGQEQKRSVPSQAEPEEHSRGQKRRPNTLPRWIQPPQQRRSIIIRHCNSEVPS